MTDEVKDPIWVKFNGQVVELRDMADAPMDGTGILVLLAAQSLSRSWHTAILRPNISIVGHQFAFDCPKMLGWLPLPEVLSEPEPVAIGEQ
jgi:hypothetical protein